MNKLYVFMGYPGSGKSTLSKQFAEERNALYLSSDEIREELFGFRDQTRNKEVFAEIEKRALEQSEVGDCLIDATNLSRKDRLKTIDRYRKRYELHLFCILRPLDELIDENEKRKKISSEVGIDEENFKRILGKFQLPTPNEGWKTISFKIVTSKDDIKKCRFDYTSMEDINHDNPHHPETIKQHIDFAVNRCKSNHLFQWLVDLAYYHDLGKFYVIRYNSEKGYSQCIGHAAVSAYIYLLDTMVDYLTHYSKQQDININDNLDLYERYVNLFNFSNIGDILNMYYLIFYHDQPYACESKEHLLKSLHKGSKDLVYWEKQGKLRIDMFTDILLGFNSIDRMRKEDDD